MRLRSREAFGCVRSEGGLLPVDLLRRVADGDRSLAGLQPAAYHLAAGERLNERITGSWNRLSGAWAAFDAERGALAAEDAGTRVTRERWLQVLFGELGYGRLVAQPAVEVDGSSFAVFSQWQHTPIHLVGANVRIDARSPGVRGAATRSPHSLVQELLNRSPERLWGLVSNGLVLRVLRDNVALTRQAFVEFDLEAMFAGEAYADFVLLWLVCHQSRVEGERPADCWLERWTHEATDTGTRALEALRGGVAEAIEHLGAGFLAHPANEPLRAALRDGVLSGQELYRQLLRVVYRLLFCFVAEDRDALLDPEAAPAARARYRQHYSTRRLRELAAQRRGGHYDDLFEALGLVFDCLHERGCPPLALPALGSFLWSPDAVPALAGARLTNVDLLGAVRALAQIDDAGVRRAVDFRHLGAEELGSVYESLLELHPVIDVAGGAFALATAAGSERKSTGSYYTPASLIGALLDSALDPVLDEAASANDPQAAILALKVCDPACGSGHFLIAAANRIAKRLAALRTDDPEPAPEAVRHALRDVVGRCIYGVDQNAMAVELCKVSLWLEALEPGRPLSFLDHRIVQGNSLLGATPALIAAGVPAAAFKALGGDDKAVVGELRKANGKTKAGQLGLRLDDQAEADERALRDRAIALADAPDDTPGSVSAKDAAWREQQASGELARRRRAADAWCAAFVADKRADAVPIIQPTVDRFALGEASAAEVEAVDALARRYGFFHWHLAFPEVFDTVDVSHYEHRHGWRGGFDVVLGNPPWEHTELKEKEFFATRAPDIVYAATGALRKRLIAALAENDPALHAEFETARRQADGISHLVRSSGRYPLTGRGRINTYAIFAESMRLILGPTGRVGCIVPTGIATDDTTKLFFGDLVNQRSLASLKAFWEVRRVFIGTDDRSSFALLTMTGGQRPVVEADFVFNAKTVDDLPDPERRFTLTAEDIALLNPNTRTCPVFRSRRDAELTKAIYRRVPVLVREGDPDGNPWGLSFKQGLFNMTSDSGLFHTREALESDGATLEGNTFVRGDERWLPLYEAKMLHHFDHRWATYDGDDTRELTPAEKADPTHLALPRYWVREAEVDARLDDEHSTLLGWRDVCRNTDERTMVTGLFPRAAVNHKTLLALLDDDRAVTLSAALSSLALDYVARQKLGGTSMSYFVVRQLPAPPLDADWPHADTLSTWLAPRILELTYTAHDLAPFAADLGHHGPPFRWDRDRRALIRAELDAAFFHLYGLDHDDTAYVLDTFPILRRREEKAFGEYRTKRLVLERYDALAAATAAGRLYETPLDPPPGDPRAAHSTTTVAA